MVDVATLTGACVVALGEYAAGAFANGEKEEQGKALEAALARAAATSAERIWPMPIFPEHTKELKGTYADLRSIGKGREGGACTAAAFLQEFVHDGVGWCHIDVAGPAMTSRPWVRGPPDATVSQALKPRCAAQGHRGEGGTGFGAALLVDWMAGGLPDKLPGAGGAAP